MVEICRWPKASLSVSLIGLHRDAEPAGLLAVDLDRRRAGRRPAPPTTTSRSVACALQRCGELGRPSRRLFGVGPGQRVLILRAARAGGDLDVLHRLEIDRHAGDRRRPRRCSRSMIVVTRRLALVARLQRDGEPAGIGRRVERADADHRNDAGHVGVACGSVRDCACRRCISANETSAAGFDHRGDQAGVLQRQEALRDDDVEPDGRRRACRRSPAASATGGAAPIRGCGRRARRCRRPAR